MTSFSCGHPKTEPNIIRNGDGVRCRKCMNDFKRQYYRSTPVDERWFDYRVRMLPTQLERARRRVAQLENEARSIGLESIL